MRKDEDLREKVHKMRLKDDFKEPTNQRKTESEKLETFPAQQPKFFSDSYEAPRKRFEEQQMEHRQHPQISSTFSYSTSELSSIPRNISTGHQASRSIDLTYPCQKYTEDHYRRLSNASDYGQSLSNKYNKQFEERPPLPPKVTNINLPRALPPTFRSYNPPSPTRSEGPPGVPCVSAQEMCQGCGEILGSGAAMLIESLGLHYHLSCFTCSVCGDQLASGYDKGADVRVRGKKLHCQDCYSNEQGI